MEIIDVRISVPQDRKSKFEISVIPKNEVIDPRLNKTWQSYI